VAAAGPHNRGEQPASALLNWSARSASSRSNSIFSASLAAGQGACRHSTGLGVTGAAFRLAPRPVMRRIGIDEGGARTNGVTSPSRPYGSADRRLVGPVSVVAASISRRRCIARCPAGCRATRRQRAAPGRRTPRPRGSRPRPAGRAERGKAIDRRGRARQRASPGGAAWTRPANGAERLAGLDPGAGRSPPRRQSRNSRPIAPPATVLRGASRGSRPSAPPASVLVHGGARRGALDVAGIGPGEAARRVEGHVGGHRAARGGAPRRARRA
jgi:hypothetical protein